MWDAWHHSVVHNLVRIAFRVCGRGWLTFKTPPLFYHGNKLKSVRISTPNSQIIKLIPGMFVLISMHF